jgi:hypothetical protein
MRLRFRPLVLISFGAAYGFGTLEGGASAATKQRPWSYAEMISCGGALQVRAFLPGLTAQQQKNYSHDDLYYGHRLIKVIPAQKRETWLKDGERAQQLWEEAARAGPAGRKAVEDRAESCRKASDTTPLPASVGVASKSSDGTITLRLTSDTPHGIAHATRVYRTSDADYYAVVAHLGGLTIAAQKAIPPWP